MHGAFLEPGEVFGGAPVLGAFFLKVGVSVLEAFLEFVNGLCRGSELLFETCDGVLQAGAFGGVAFAFFEKGGGALVEF